MSGVPSTIPTVGDVPKRKKAEDSQTTSASPSTAKGPKRSRRQKKAARDAKLTAPPVSMGNQDNGEGGGGGGGSGEAKLTAPPPMRAAAGGASTGPKYAHHFVMVCRSNMNRSMANHHILESNGFRVSSYGIGKEVKVPSRDKKGLSLIHI